MKESLKAPSWGIAIAILLIFLLMYFSQEGLKQETQRYPIEYSQFLAQLEAGHIASVSIKGLRVKGAFGKKVKLKIPAREKPVEVKDFQTNLPSFQGEELIDKLRAKKVAIQVEPAQGSGLWQVLIWILPWVLIIGVWVFIMRRSGQQMMGGGRGGPFGFGQSKARLYDVTQPKVSYEDVAGLQNVKKELHEIIEFLKDPAKFTRIGAEIPKGVLLVGPPGSGKTLLAKATAGEAGVPFYSVSASEFIEMFVGVGASRVRDMFNRAKETKPSLIFIDEIDAVGRTRGAGLGGGHDEREQTLNQLLSEMDGFDPNEGVIVIAATNRPDVLDPALLRPGRFDRQLVIQKPGWKERQAILQVHTRNKKMADKVDLERLARETPGMTGADLENLVNEAALVALRHNKERIDTDDLEEAKDKILMGTVREEVMSDSEKRITAYHEAGHTLAAWELPGSDPIHKVSILPRGMSMGATQIVPEEDRHYYPKKYLENRITVALAGRVAEKLVFEDISTGAQSDLKEATAMAERMVGQWGMSEKVGPVSLGRGEEHPFLGRELAVPKKYSDELAWLMDQEIRRFIVEAEKHARSILTENRDNLDKLAEALLKEETLEMAAIEKIIGHPRKRNEHD
ncbi:MAG: ATP-dependent zinc metalloprotease FtsH [Deltaproteobacteria bacterium]